MMYVIFDENKGFGKAFKSITDAYNHVLDYFMAPNTIKRIKDRRVVIADEKGEMKIIYLEDGKEIDHIYIKKINY